MDISKKVGLAVIIIVIVFVISILMLVPIISPLAPSPTPTSKPTVPITPTSIPTPIPTPTPSPVPTPREADLTGQTIQLTSLRLVGEGLSSELSGRLRATLETRGLSLGEGVALEAALLLADHVAGSVPDAAVDEYYELTIGADGIAIAAGGERGLL